MSLLFNCRRHVLVISNEKSQQFTSITPQKSWASLFRAGAQRKTKRKKTSGILFITLLTQTVFTHRCAFFHKFKIFISTPMTSSVITGDCAAQKTWYFHRTTVKQDGVWHGRRSVGGHGHSPYFLNWRGRPVFCPPSFRGRHFCINAHGILWMIGAIFVKFSRLILMTIIKVVATRCQIFRLKCT